ncbi:sigma-70 family RNA polymerase sigma factor [bacterium]|nr:sigma-70 family RNA polymerase sigma factor [bacterium]
MEVTMQEGQLGLLEKGNRTPVLSAEEEKYWIRLFKREDQEAKKVLMEKNLPFIIKLAKKDSTGELPLVDLVHEGVLGFYKAVEKYDMDMNCRLLTYAGWWIRLYIKRAVISKSKSVKFPNNKVEKFNKIKQTREDLFSELGRNPTVDELSSHIDMDENTIEKIERQFPSIQSIDRYDDEDNPLEDTLKDKNNINPRDQIWLEETRSHLTKAIKRLNSREREVLLSRYDFKNNEELNSLRSVGEKIGMSPEGVRCIEKKAFDKLRNSISLNSLQYDFR